MTNSNLKLNFGDVLGLLYQSYLPKIINAAIKIDLFEVLSPKKLTLSELSKKLNTNETITDALLDVLIAINLIKKHNSKYSLTQLSEDFVLKTSETNQISAIKMYSGSVGPFDNLAKVIIEGPPAFNDRMWSSREAILSMEQQAKGGMIQAVLSFVKGIPEFKSCKRMCDFAGSIGYFSFAFMQENPEIQSHLYDLPEVCKLGREIKEKEENRNRITFHDFDVSSDESFGEGYDLFFSSHFLYEFNAENILVDFLKRVNKSMTLGGIFVSSHIAPLGEGESNIVLPIIELMTRMSGYPTHQLPERDLKTVLTHAGFGQFRTKMIERELPYPILALSAVKTDEV